jgi:hypothetical protein
MKTIERSDYQSLLDKHGCGDSKTKVVGMDAEGTAIWAAGSTLYGARRDAYKSARIGLPGPITRKQEREFVDSLVYYEIVG